MVMDAATHQQLVTLRKIVGKLRQGRPIHFEGRKFPLLKIEKSNITMLNPDDDED
jgi:hypothetical protein